MNAPDWLVQRGGALKLGSDGKTWYVFLNSQPTYRLIARPVSSKFGCVVQQTNNGKGIPSQGTGATAAEAIGKGLDDLRAALGWG